MSKAPTQVGTNTNTTTTSVPQFVQDAQKNLMDAAGNLTLPLASQGVPAEPVAPFNADQQRAFALARQLTTSAFAKNPFKQFGSYNAEAAQVDPNDIQRFFNPYQKDVVGTTTQQLAEANDKQLAAIRARQGAEGAYGGNRGALEELEQNRNFGNTLASTVAGLNNQGWQQALQPAMQDAGWKQQGNLFNAQQTLAAEGQSWQQKMQALQGLLGVGGQQQGLTQKTTDLPYTALDIFRSVVPGQYSTSGTSSQPIYGPSPFQTAATVGTLGAGLFGASDRTLKTDIVKLGKDENTDLDIFSFRYKGDPKDTMKVVGPMAQDVEEKYPGSTVRIAGKMAIKPAARMMLGI